MYGLAINSYGWPLTSADFKARASNTTPARLAGRSVASLRAAKPARSQDIPGGGFPMISQRNDMTGQENMQSMYTTAIERMLSQALSQTLKTKNRTVN